MDVLEEVTHYFEHCEFEMAFEGLLIELTNVGRYPKDFKYSEWLELAALYKLDKGFVFDEEIWRKFAAWGEAYVVSD